MNDIVHFLIPVFILIALVCCDYVVTEFKILIIMLKIKRCEKICKKSKKRTFGDNEK